jgi:hypothetical protein
MPERQAAYEKAVAKEFERTGALARPDGNRTLYRYLHVVAVKFFIL